MGNGNAGGQPGFWPTAIGGFALGALTVLLVLLLARKTNDPEPRDRQPDQSPPVQVPR